MRALWLFILALLAALPVQGCKDASTFSGSGKKEKKDPPRQSAPPRSNGSAQGDPNLQVQPNSCYQNQQIKRYNVIFVFDSSTSMKTVDPGFARAIGAELLVDRLADLTPQIPDIQFQISMVRFATYAEQSRAGWIPVSPNSVPAIRQEIKAITANPVGGTSYVDAFRTAGNLFTRTNATGPESRNLVLFLTDGDPSDRPFEVQQEVEMLTRSFNAIIIAIAAGQQLSSEGISLVQSLAQPRVPLGADPRHVGRFHMVATPDQFSGIFDQIYENIFGCSGAQQVSLK